MGLLLISTTTEILLTFAVLIWSIYRYLTKDYNFWAKRGVPFGSLKGVLLGREQLSHAYDSVYKEFPKERFCGVVELGRSVLVIRDPDLVKQVLIKDFNHFVDRAPFDVNRRERIANHLFVMDEDDWRKTRHKLSPAFTSGKMKNMFFLIKKCAEQLSDCVQKTTETQEDVNVKDLLARFTMDVIASCAFGLEINSLVDRNSAFYKMGVAIFRPPTKMVIKHRIYTLFPKLGEIFNFQRIAQDSKEMLYSMVSNTVKYREENNFSRNDFLDILIKLRNNKSIIDGTEEESDFGTAPKTTTEEGMTLEEMTSQAFIFFAAGFETASSTMTFCLYELARNPDVQQRLCREVDTVLEKQGGELCYQALQEMKYMDQVIDETLRMHASLGVLHRRCTQRYRIPDSDLVLEKGQKVCIPIYAIHHDPKYYPEPYKFDPERFNPDNCKTRHSHVHLPFGDGPRNCIGMRFGLMQTKAGLTTVLSQYKVEICPSTTVPIVYNPTSFVVLPKHPVFLRVTKR